MSPKIKKRYIKVLKKRNKPMGVFGALQAMIRMANGTAQEREMRQVCGVIDIFFKNARLSQPTDEDGEE